MSEITDLAPRVGAALSGLGSEQSTAEFHGALVGLLCAEGKPIDREEWVSRVVPAGGEGPAEEAREIFSALFAQTVSQMNDPLLEFNLLLPDDDEPLQARVEALGEWCQGFLMGLGEGGLKETGRLPRDVEEIVSDIGNISRAGSYELSGSEEDEESYADLVEYVRTGVLLLNEELHPVTKAPPGRLH